MRFKSSKGDSIFGILDMGEGFALNLRVNWQQVMVQQHSTFKEMVFQTPTQVIGNTTIKVMLFINGQMELNRWMHA
jgi:hypothetical protein